MLDALTSVDALNLLGNWALSPNCMPLTLVWLRPAILDRLVLPRPVLWKLMLLIRMLRLNCVLARPVLQNAVLPNCVLARLVLARLVWTSAVLVRLVLWNDDFMVPVWLKAVDLRTALLNMALDSLVSARLIFYSPERRIDCLGRVMPRTIVFARLMFLNDPLEKLILARLIYTGFVILALMTLLTPCRQPRLMGIPGKRGLVALLTLLLGMGLVNSLYWTPAGHIV